MTLKGAFISSVRMDLYEANSETLAIITFIGQHNAYSVLCYLDNIVHCSEQ